MSIRRTTKLVTGVIAALATLSLLALPAAANTVPVNTAGGTLVLRNPGGAVLGAIPLAPAPLCSIPGSTVTTIGNINTGTFNAGLNYHSAVNIGGLPYIMTLAIGVTGTYGVAPPAYAINGTGSATAVFVRSTGPGSCVPLGGFGNCTVSAANITWTGTLNAANAAALVIGDNGVLNGNNVAPNTTVAGGAANCGPVLIANHLGSNVFNGVVFVA